VIVGICALRKHWMVQMATPGTQCPFNHDLTDAQDRTVPSASAASREQHLLGHPAQGDGLTTWSLTPFSAYHSRRSRRPPVREMPMTKGPGVDCL
jgi:hypothetical protein